MAEVTSNIDEVEDLLNKLVAGFNFTVPGKDGSLGLDMAGVAARGIVDRTVVEQLDTGGEPLRATEPAYTRRKQRKYGTDLVGVRTGQMLSDESMKGDVAVSEDVVEMKYGTGDPPAKAGNGTELSHSDEAITDREKAGYFEAGGRSFFALDDKINEELGETAGDALKDYLS